MTSIVITMIVVLTVAAGALVFVAFPHRGEDVPGARWLGRVMGRAAGAVPTLRESDADALARTGTGADTEPHAGTFADALGMSYAGGGDRDGSAWTGPLASSGRRA